MAHDLAWFPVYATETLADERFQGWTCEERGAWFSLALVCWHEGSIPASHDQLRRLLHLDAPTFSVVWQQIGDRFAPSDEKPDRLTSPRMEKERVKARRIVAERAKAGAKGGKAKAQKALKSPSNCQANAKQGAAVALANPAPSPSPVPTPNDPPDQGAQAPLISTPLVAFLLATYPDVQDPHAAEAAWTKAYPRLDLLAEALKAHAWETADSKRAKKNHGAFLNRWFSNATDRLPPPAPPPPQLPSLDAAWLETLPAGERARALTEWGDWVDELKRTAYSDALPRLMETAAAEFKARWEPLPLPSEVA